MNLTNEQIQKATQAQSVEELIAIAKEYGEELTEEQANQIFTELHKQGELTDDELDNVSGGCNDGKTPTADAKFSDNSSAYLTTVGKWVIVQSHEWDDGAQKWKYRVTQTVNTYNGDGTWGSVTTEWTVYEEALSSTQC